MIPHESPRTTKLYARMDDKVTREEIKTFVIQKRNLSLNLRIQPYSPVAVVAVASVFNDQLQ